MKQQVVMMVEMVLVVTKNLDRCNIAKVAPNMDLNVFKKDETTVNGILVSHSPFFILNFK